MIREIKTDVLVIGGGAAGLMAALEAKKHDVDVTIVSKKKVGRSGNTVVSGGALSVVVSEEDNPDSIETYYSDLLTSGKFINQKILAKKFAEKSVEALSLLEQYGVEFYKLNNKYIKRKPPGHTFPRSVPTVWDGFSYMTRGLTFTLPLQQSAIKHGINIIDNTFITKLVKIDGRIVGAKAFNEERKETISIHCSSIVIASGGAGWIYANTNNTRDITGDSYSLAYDAGATLIDMEFVQFYPSMIIEPIKMPASNPLFGDGAVLRNKDNKRFMFDYDEKGDMATRDKMAQSIFMEVKKGNGINGGVYFDCSGIPKEVIKTKYQHFADQLKKKGVDISKDMILVAPSTHYFLGGVMVNEDCESDVLGLYAAGEAIGGIHGANRLSGNSIADTIVFGAIAGKSAGRYSRKMSLNLDAFKEDDEITISNSLVSTIDIKELKEKIRNIMWNYASVIRSEDGLKQAIKEIENIRHMTNQITVINTNDYTSFKELENMLVVSRLVIKGALERKESRGSHLRVDFQAEDSQFSGNFYYQCIGNEDVIKFHPSDECIKN